MRARTNPPSLPGASGELRVIFFGKTGAGKSSTINALFHLNRPTDNAVSCTREVEALTVADPRGRALVVVDTPGLSESQEKDVEYLPLYQSALVGVHHVVWLLQGDTRTYRADQRMLRSVLPFFPTDARLTIGVNHIDCIGPGDWDPTRNVPSRQQQLSIQERIADVVRKMSKVAPLTTGQVVCYSATRGFGLDRLRNRLVSKMEV